MQSSNWLKCANCIAEHKTEHENNKPNATRARTQNEKARKAAKKETKNTHSKQQQKKYVSD